jgi:hypothetical protein
MDPDLKKLSLEQDKIIENLLNIIRTVGYSTHYLQQACISNLLVTVFAVLHPLANPQRTNGQTARHLANTAP